MWKFEYTKKFLKELATLPKDIQSRIEAIVFNELEIENPFELAYLGKMKGYKAKINIKLE
jgi:mRNA interferase RelE/StbE